MHWPVFAACGPPIELPLCTLARTWATGVLLLSLEPAQCCRVKGLGAAS